MPVRTVRSGTECRLDMLPSQWQGLKEDKERVFSSSLLVQILHVAVLAPYDTHQMIMLVL